MRQGQSDIGHNSQNRQIQVRAKDVRQDDFVLEKGIFNSVFEKDIRRVFIYKKAERLAKAVHLIAPAFAESTSLRNRIDAIAMGLVDAAILPTSTARTALSRELLTLSSVLSIARTSNLLSTMNAELITREAHILLQEITSYEEPRLSLDEAPTLSTLAKSAVSRETVRPQNLPIEKSLSSEGIHRTNNVVAKKRVIKDIRNISDNNIKDRRDAIMSVIENKGNASIKDISTLIRGVSEKTIQRELTSLIASGVVLKQGERRWSTYSLI